MMPWEQRPREIANLLNPAFCGEILRICVKEYEDIASHSFPFALIFLVLPMDLHERTRKSIPNSARTQLHVWLQSHQEAKIGFAERAKQLVPITKEAILFLLQLGVFQIDEEAGLSTAFYKTPKNRNNDWEIAECYSKAKIIGKWFAHSGTPPTIYSMWGVKP